MPVVKPDALTISRAADSLRKGLLVAFPTETVYGLGADARNGRAIAAVYEAKGRPRFNPLIVHVANVAAARAITRFDTRAEKLAAQFWPGPLTLVLKARPEAQISELVSAGLDTLAVRVPGHPVALALLAEAGVPVAAPSANISGHVSPTTAGHVEADLGSIIDIILDGGPCKVGLESTVVDLSGEPNVLLRPGGVCSTAIEGVLGTPLVKPDACPSQPASPGQLESHYAPAALVRLNADAVYPGEGLLAFGANGPVHSGPVVNLSESGDLREAAMNLFSALRELDATGIAGIAVVPIPSEGLGEAINDRLIRAAAPRPR